MQTILTGSLTLGGVLCPESSPQTCVWTDRVTLDVCENAARAVQG